MKYSSLNNDTKKQILGEMKIHFDQITIENASEYLMELLEGTEYYIESFQTWNIINGSGDTSNKFDKHKLRLFLSGVRLYKRNTLKEFKLLCDIEDEYWDSTR